MERNRYQTGAVGRSLEEYALEYSSIFDIPPWSAIGLSVLQTLSLYCIILLGLKLAGRRVFAERSPQDLVTIVLVAEACNQGLADQDAGYWGAFASVITIIILGVLTEKVPAIRHILNQSPVVIYDGETLDRRAMKKHSLGEDDLNEAARKQGFDSYRKFARILLEGDGRISGEFRKANPEQFTGGLPPAASIQ